MSKRIGWLGWVLAAVLAVTAGGAALAATRTAAPSTTAAAAGAQQPRGGFPGGLAGWRWARRAVHGEATVRTANGFTTVVFARGKVTAVSATSVTITANDNVAVTFTLTGDTRYGTKRLVQSKADLKVGVRAAVLGERSGGGDTARRVLVARAGGQQGGGGQSTTPTS